MIKPGASIFDLHVDLLSYLAEEQTRTPYDQQSRCSIPQLLAGRVAFQVLPVFTKTGDSSLSYGEAQLDALKDLLRTCPEVRPLETFRDLSELPASTETVTVAAAFENASGFCGELEPLAVGIERFDSIVREHGPLVYVSLTWNGENRFGGGCGASAGLKDDGRALLLQLEKRGIAVDISHASDQLASDVLDMVERERCSLKVLASHSNFRSVCGVPRNLPDTIARRIIALGGIIGLNSIEEFLGGLDIHALGRHVRHGLALGGENALALGSDFFCETDVPPEDGPPDGSPMFAPYWESSSMYPEMIGQLPTTRHVSTAVLQKILCDNVARVLSGDI